MMTIRTLWIGQRKQSFTDLEVVTGLQSHERKTEEWFYRTTRRYFDEHFNRVFFDKDRKQEIFQQAFLKLWTEIDNGRISVLEDKVCRQQNDGSYSPMTCSLTTFLMAFARTEHREIVRNIREENYPELHDTVDTATVIVTSFDMEEDAEEQKRRIVDDCISQLAPRCTEILTLFYYQGKSLDEILDIRKEKNSSKNGLKTAKNKCMNTLREHVAAEFQKYNLKI